MDGQHRLAPYHHAQIRPGFGKKGRSATGCPASALWNASSSAGRGSRPPADICQQSPPGVCWHSIVRSRRRGRRAWMNRTPSAAIAIEAVPGAPGASTAARCQDRQWVHRRGEAPARRCPRAGGGSDAAPRGAWRPGLQPGCDAGCAWALSAHAVLRAFPPRCGAESPRQRHLGPNHLKWMLDQRAHSSHWRAARPNRGLSLRGLQGWRSRQLVRQRTPCHNCRRTLPWSAPAPAVLPAWRATAPGALQRCPALPGRGAVARPRDR